MGCGKSSVGKRLSELLCCRFMDLDEVIVEREGRSIPEIFAEDGEGEFRRMEKEALKSILATDGRAPEIPKTPALVTLGHPLAGGGMSLLYLVNHYQNNDNCTSSSGSVSAGSTTSLLSISPA